MDVHITGTSDVRNFGDLLFPLVAAHRLAPAGINVISVSPTGRVLPWADAIPSLAFEQLLTGEVRTGGLLIGGGHIITDLPTSAFNRLLVPEDRYPAQTDSLNMSLWLGASLVGAVQNAPVLWNAPGVAGPFVGQSIRRLADAALAAADHVSVRDEESRRFLGRSHTADITISPDTALDISGLWPRSVLRGSFKRLLWRKGFSAEETFVAVHVRFGPDEESFYRTLAACIDALSCTFSLTPLLVAVGPGLGDDHAVRKVSPHLSRRHLLLDDPVGLKEIAAALAHSRLYIGAALHGYIVSLAYEVPGILVGRAPARRFKGVMARLGRSADLVSDWATAFDLAGNRLQSGYQCSVSPCVRGALDAHWANLEGALQTRTLRARERQAFLKTYVKIGCSTGQIGWALSPMIPSDIQARSWIRKS